MTYLTFKTPDDFLSYQDILIKNWTTHKKPSEMCFLYRSTGRTTREKDCIRELLIRGDHVLYVVHKLAHHFYFDEDDIVNQYRDKYQIIDIQTYRNNINNVKLYASIIPSTDKKYVVFDHAIFEKYYP